MESPLRNRARSSANQALSFYIHIPYCVKRCGYCDFNTYTPQELSTPDLKLITTPYIDSVIREIDQAHRKVGSIKVPTIFFGGGTPSLIPADEIARVISAIESKFDLMDSIEVTLEANPDSVDLKYLDEIRKAGVNRISMGMQSAVPHVLKVLDRTHNPENVAGALEMAKSAGFEHLSVDLIYGSPGESVEDWRVSYETALTFPIDHISAYALIVEPGTKLAAQIKRGELVMPLDDEAAEKYLLFDAAASKMGFEWYELSNWAKPGGQCRHNIAYWDGSYWWGVGPGAHSYWDGKRWWNVKHPNSYQGAINTGQSPESNSETLNEENLRDEFIMLQIRMRTGISITQLTESERLIAERFLDTGHIASSEWETGRLVLTSSGRLIADRIVRELLV